VEVRLCQRRIRIVPAIIGGGAPVLAGSHRLSKGVCRTVSYEARCTATSEKEVPRRTSAHIEEEQDETESFRSEMRHDQWHAYVELERWL